MELAFVERISRGVCVCDFDLCSAIVFCGKFGSEPNPKNKIVSVVHMHAAEV